MSSNWFDTVSWEYLIFTFSNEKVWYKDTFSLVKGYAMKQIQSQYKNKLYHLYQDYLKEKGRPKYISPEDWNWLIKNK